MEKKAEGLDLRSSLLTLGKTDASIVLLSLNRSLPSTLVRTPLLRRGGGDWGLQSSHRCGCGPTKGSKSLILSPLSLRKRPLDIPKGGAFRAKRGKKAERATEDFRAAIDMAAAPQKGVRALK